MDITNLCLGILSLGDASGYQIKKTLEQTFSHFQSASFGSIYPTLNKMTDAGWVSYTQVEQSKRPAKKVFHITPSGREKFHSTLMTLQPADQYKSDFLALMMFAHLLPEARLQQILQQQTEQLESELNTLTAIQSDCQNLTPGMRFTLEYGIAANSGLLKLMQQRQKELIKEVVDASNNH